MVTIITITTNFAMTQLVMSSLTCWSRVKIAYQFSNKLSYFVQARHQNDFTTKQEKTKKRCSQ